MILRFGIGRATAEVAHTAVLLINLAMIARLVDQQLLALYAVVSAIVLFAPQFLSSAFSLPLAIHGESGTHAIARQFRILLIWSVASLVISVVAAVIYTDLLMFPKLLFVTALIVLLPVEQFFVNISEQNLSLKTFFVSKLLKAAVLLLATQVLLKIDQHVLALSLPLPLATAASIFYLLRRLRITNLVGAIENSARVRGSGHIIFQKLISYTSNAFIPLFLSQRILPVDLAAHANVTRVSEFASGFLDRPISSIVMQIANREYSHRREKYEFFMDCLRLQLVTSFPAMACLYLFSQDVFILLMGERWESYSGLFRLLNAVALVNFLSPSVSQFYMSLNRLSIYSALLALRLIAISILFFGYGIDSLEYEGFFKGWVYIGAAFGGSCTLSFLIYTATKLKLGWRPFSDYVKATGIPILVSFIIWKFSYLLPYFESPEKLNLISQLLELVITSLLLGIFYLSAVLFFSRGIRDTVFNFVRESYGRKVSKNEL